MVDIYRAGGGGSILTVVETEVFNSSTTPTSWSDLDLNAVVGANPALVLLKFWYPSGGYNLAVRKNGDTDEFWTSGDLEAGGVAIFEHAGIFNVLWVATDNAGVIEWITEASGNATTIDVIAFIK